MSCPGMSTDLIRFATKLHVSFRSKDSDRKNSVAILRILLSFFLLSLQSNREELTKAQALSTKMVPKPRSALLYENDDVDLVGEFAKKGLFSDVLKKMFLTFMSLIFC